MSYKILEQLRELAKENKSIPMDAKLALEIYESLEEIDVLNAATEDRIAKLEAVAKAAREYKHVSKTTSLYALQDLERALEALDSEKPEG